MVLRIGCVSTISIEVDVRSACKPAAEAETTTDGMSEANEIHLPEMVSHALIPHADQQRDRKFFKHRHWELYQSAVHLC